MKKHIHWCEWMRRVSLILTISIFIFLWTSFASFSGAKSSVKWQDISSGGPALWVFLIIGGLVILLQLIPAVVVFLSLLTGAHKAITVDNTVEAPCCAHERTCSGKESMEE